VKSRFVYDAFIAYAREDFEYARRMHDLLCAAGYNIFYDQKLLGGDIWLARVGEKQDSSLVNVVLVSDNTTSAASFYVPQEINRAVVAFTERSTPLVPVWLPGEKSLAEILSHLGLGHVQAITWSRSSSCLAIAQQVELTILALKERHIANHKCHMGPNTIVIVTGCDQLPELFDRPCAYDLKSTIDSLVIKEDSIFLRSIVMGDRWFFGSFCVQ
jgi:hypothetical protein